MLRREDAEKRLKAFQIKNWHAKALTALGALSAKQAEPGRALLGRDAGGKPFKDWSKRRDAFASAIERLEKMSARDRQKVFAALFPKLGATLEAAWQLCARLPYETGHDRKAFRAPSDATAVREGRRNWLENLLDELENYDPDVLWCATWAAYLGGYGGADALGILLAATIDTGGDEGEAVFEVLRESATNAHEIGSMGRHVTRALMVASRPDGWEFVEKLLLAAQRQEGLRQTILESIDEAHPEAFRRMVRLLLDRDLVRFSATVRAVDVWFGLAWGSVSAGVVKKALEQALRFLEEPQARADALARATGETLYLALWATAFEDAPAAVKPAAPLLADPNVERRFIAVHFLDHLGLAAARKEVARCLEDDDLRIALRALESLEDRDEKGELFDSLVKLFERMPEKPADLPALVWPWATTRAQRQDVADKLLQHLGKRPPTVLLPYLSAMSSYARGRVVMELAEQKKWDAATRDTFFALLGDRDGWVRERALEAVKKCEVTDADAQRIEELLTRKNSQTRQAVLALLKKQKGPQALASVDRLLASSKAPQRLSGLELARLLVESKRSAAECRERAVAYQEQRKNVAEEEQVHLDAILDARRAVPTLDDALGLLNPAERSKPVAPVARKVVLLTPAAVACIKALEQLVEDNAETPVSLGGYRGEGEALLGNVSGYDLPDPDGTVPAEKDAERLPLRRLWEEWYANRPPKLRDKDGLELLRAAVWCDTSPDSWKDSNKRFGAKWGPYLKLLANGQPPVRVEHDDLIQAVLQWLLRLHPPEKAPDFLLDVLETSFAMVPEDVRKRVVDLQDWSKRDRDWRIDSPIEKWQGEVEEYRDLVPGAWTQAHSARTWELLHWRDEPVPGVARQRPNLPDLLAALEAGRVKEADLYDHLLGPGEDQDDLGILTEPVPDEALDRFPLLKGVVERCRERILEVELTRGETPTAASGPASKLSSVWGTDLLVRLLGGLGKKPFSRRTEGTGRTEVFTHLVRCCYPLPGDTAEAFAEKMKKVGAKRERLLELAFLAPQWLPFVEHAVGWAGLSEGTWWFLAHTPGGHKGVPRYGPQPKPEGARSLDPWERTIHERTPLTEDERNEGATDPAWFRKAFAPLEGKRWAALAEASKYGCGDLAHKKAVLLGDVLQGRASKRDLIAGARQRMLKENVRLLGLLPLAEGKERDADLLARYTVLMEYRRYARSLGPMSREEAVRAFEVGVQNLARTAGYPDPIRLEWAMEARSIADLAAGPVSVTHQGVTVTLTLNDSAGADVTVKKGDKVLKAIPAEVRKHPKVAAMTERRAELKRQASRMRQSLETAMWRGDKFSGAELAQLFAHPLLASLLERLVLLGEGIRGYAVAGGRGLADYNGRVEPVKPGEQLRIAHPHDLLRASDWHKWQSECFQKERVQPFKQVFRELYVAVDQEKKGGTTSERYAGQQVNPNQAMALFGSRGWATREGVERSFHEAGLTASVTFRNHGGTPAEMEGLTVHGVEFRRRGEWKPMPLADVPPRIFSEVMRDVDLVVSVAHLGGVDPEASASTVEMRAALVRETCALLQISNFAIKSSHAVIAGKLGKYTVHLGSGVVHRQPGGHVCIVPVHAQHRGRLFLPFADDDPRTAELLSKVILLARDHEIQDPTILDQLR